MSIIQNILGKIDLSNLKFKRKTEEKKSLLKDVLNEPEKFILEACIENEEIIVKIKRRES